MYVFSSDNDFFFLSFLFFFLFLRLSSFPDCIFLSLYLFSSLLFFFFFTHCFSFFPLSYFFAVFSSACTSSSRTGGNLSSFIPFVFNPIRTCNFIPHFSHKYVFFLEKIYIYIYLISAIFYIAQQMNASNSNSSNYNLERKFIYIRRNIVDVRK